MVDAIRQAHDGYLKRPFVFLLFAFRQHAMTDQKLVIAGDIGGTNSRLQVRSPFTRNVSLRPLIAK
jgi:hypothetical protein